MNEDLRDACVALVLSRTSGPVAGRGPRPSALGWRLERDVTSREVEALHASIRGALTGAAEPRRWTGSTWLRALLAEYRDVRREVQPSRPRLAVARRDAVVRSVSATRAGRPDCNS